MQLLETDHKAVKELPASSGKLTARAYQASPTVGR